MATHKKWSRKGIRACGCCGCCGCGGCGADAMYDVRVYPCTPTVMQLIKKANTNVLASSAGLSSRKPYACSLREQVPGVPKCKITQPQGEEKDCEARPPHPPLLRRKGGAIFSIASALDAQGLGPVYHENRCLDVSSW